MNQRFTISPRNLPRPVTVRSQQLSFIIHASGAQWGQSHSTKSCSRTWLVRYNFIYGRPEYKTELRIALDVGQLVKDEFFTLFESIGAIEV